jgi:transposase
MQRLLLPDGPSACALSREVGISQGTLSRWLRGFGKEWGVSNENKETESGPRRPEDWTVKERLRAVVEAEKLSDEQLGEFLRREGLHEETLEEWSAAVHEALSPADARLRAAAVDKKRIQKLEKELAKKDRALAAANAIVVLQKKVHALWEAADDDTKPEPDE